MVKLNSGGAETSEINREASRKNIEIMNLKDANCRNCYKCVRACPVKAISIIGEHAKIEDSRCVYCGKCYLVCPQNAKDLAGDLDRVKLMLAADEKVYASVSSESYAFFNGTTTKQLGTAFKKLGFIRVEETATGAIKVIEEYNRIMREHKMQNILSTVCPGSNFLVQKYFPNLVKWMCPVDTPLEAHAKMMKAAYGDDIKVVGVGPCIAYQKLANISHDGKLIDAYLTYEEIEEWFRENNIDPLSEPEDHNTRTVSNYRARYLDESGGLVRAMDSDLKYSYKLWENNGESRVRDSLKGLTEDTEGYFFTLTSCSNSCLGGPIVRLKQKNDFKSKDLWLEGVKENIESGTVNPSEQADVDISKSYKPLPIEERNPTEEEIQYFLSLIGMEKGDLQIDCSGCGYPSCREKAKAAARGMADPFMCIPHAMDKAEAKSNLLFDNSPSGIVVLDKELQILEVNKNAEEILLKDAEELIGSDIRDFFGADFFDNVMFKEKEVVRDTVNDRKLGKLLTLEFFKIYRHDIYMLVMDDRTSEREKYEKDVALREDAMSVAQEVVEKQMRIAQEIAFLLGETTAETKLAINRMKQTFEESDSGWEI